MLESIHNYVYFGNGLGFVVSSYEERAEIIWSCNREISTLYASGIFASTLRHVFIVLVVSTSKVSAVELKERRKSTSMASISIVHLFNTKVQEVIDVLGEEDRVLLCTLPCYRLRGKYLIFVIL